MMKQKKIISFVLAACMVFNFTIQAMPADAFDNTEESKAASLVSSEETPITVASGNAIFTMQEDPAESTEDTSKSSEDDLIEEATMTAILSNEISIEQNEPTETEDENIISGVCGLDTVYTYDKSTHTLVVSGKGEAANLEGKIWDNWDNDYNAIETVIFKSGITSIGEKFCNSADSLVKVELADSITYIGDYAFNGCENLSDIKFSKNTTQIGRYAFHNTSWYNSQKDGVVYADKVAYSYKGEMPENFELKFKEGTVGIANDAFYQQVNLTSVVMPESIISVGNRAFYERHNLSKITMSENIGHIGLQAFDGTKWRSSLPTGPIYIGKVFYDYIEDSNNHMPENTAITIKDGTVEIAARAFYWDNNLTSINIPDSVERIGEEAFNDAGLTEISIPNSVKAIGERAFYMCDELTTVTLSEGLESIEESTFEYCFALTEINIPKSVKTIGKNAFSSCTKLTSVTLNEGLKVIGISAFYHCNFEKITIPDTVIQLGYRSFHNCENLTGLKLSSSLKEIPTEAFSDCKSLSNIVIPNGVEEIGKCAFEDCADNLTVTISETIKTTNFPWGFYGAATDECKKLGITLIIADGPKTLTRDMIGSTQRFIRKVVLPDTITSIDDYAFMDCYQLESINIPKFVKNIGRMAFHGCTHLESINIPESVKNIGNHAFYNCRSLKFLEIPDSVTELSEGICQYCKSLESVKLPANVNQIPKYAFEYCNSLKEVISDVKEFDFHISSFEGCSSLYDTRFLFIDKRNINLSANTETIKNNGIVNFSLTYKLTPNIFQKGVEATLTLHVPKGIKLSNDDNIEDQDYYYEQKLKDFNGTLNFSAKVLEYGDYNVSAYITYSYAGETGKEEIGSVNIKAPLISISSPTSTNGTSIRVNGLAKPGEKVSVFADGVNKVTVTANEKTGKYSAVINNLTEKQNGENYQLYAMASGEKTDVVSVVYAPEKATVAAVNINYNDRSESLDITSVFTDGKQPVISINPSYPFEFEIDMYHPEKINQLYVISQKGDDIKSLEAFWNEEKQLWVAEGYFDPENQGYVPGGLNISIYENEPVTFDFSKGIIDTKNDQIFEDLYEGTGISQSEWSNKIEDIPEPTLPEKVFENSTAKVVEEKKNAAIVDFHLSDGNRSEDFSVYTDTSNSTFVDGKMLTAEQVAKKPEAYGFIKSDVKVVSENGKEYVFYVRTLSPSDIKSHVFHTFNLIDDNNNKESWEISAGTQILKIPKKLSSNFKFSLQSEESAAVSPQSELQVSTLKNGLSTEISTEKATQANKPEFINNFMDFFENFLPNSLPDTIKDNGIDMLKRRKMSSYGPLNKLDNILSIGKISVKTYDRFRYLHGVDNSTDLRAEVLGVAAADTALSLLSSCSLNIGIAIGSLILGSVAAPTIGTLAVATAVGLCVTMFINALCNWISGKANIFIDDKIATRKLAFIENGYVKFLIDPSGYVYEAVDGNRIEGAKMTIYYKDPDTGKQVEWTAEDYDQINPLLTDKNGQYAWDVPEGLWRVKFEKEGYETAYSDWMNVPPIQTDVNFSVKSLEAPKIIDAAIVDGAINITLSKYMEVKTISTKSVSVMDGNKKVNFKIDPVLTNDGDIYANKFIITPVSGKFSSKNLKVSFSNTCKSYSGVSLKEQPVQVTVPKNIISITAEDVNIIAAQNQAKEVSITAKPASAAVGKKLIVKSSSEDVIISEAVFDKNGVAVISINSSFTGIEQLTFSVEGSDLTAEVTLITVTQEEYEAMNSNYVQGDVNGDNKISVADVVLLQRYLVKKVEFTNEQWKLADLNSDGKVNVFDVIILKRKFLK